MRRLVLVFLLLLALAFAAALTGIFLAGGSRSLTQPRFLTWRIDAPLVDYSETAAFAGLGRGAPRSLASLHQILGAARHDERVEGVAIYIQSARFGLGKTQELLSLLDSFRAAGKSVECYLETAGEGTNGTLAYYLASACTHISLSPLGEWNVVGLYSDAPFVRGTLDKLRIEPQFLHVGDYKSAAEFYTESEHTPAAEEALASVLDDLFDQIVSAVAEARDLSPARVRDLIDQAPLDAAGALEAGLIDDVAYPDQFEARLAALHGDIDGWLPIGKYAAGTKASWPRVAVVVAQGTIVRGANGVDPWSQQRFIGAQSLGEILRQLAAEPRIAGVVLRVDSPGGSPLASDLILREVERLAANRPLIVSMSDVAASGGYYISTKADAIVAQPATITGSIGVVGGKLATRRFQQELLGISHDSLQRGANADYYSSLDPFTPEQEARFLASMNHIYEVFLGHVAAGRGMSRGAVEEVAGGRIWTGRQAREIGLVDATGGLDTAIRLVVERAGLDPERPVAVEFYPRPKSLLDLLSEGLSPFLQMRQGPLLPPPALRLPYALELPPGLLELLDPV